MARRLLLDVSLWSAGLANLERALAIASPHADSFHVDVADGHFAPALLFFPDLLAALRPLTAAPFHVHLMVERPSQFVAPFVAAGADAITVHAETGAAEAGRAIDLILGAGRSAGVALCPETSISEAAAWAAHVAMFVLLATRPGIKGVEPAPDACGRIRALDALLRNRGSRERARITVDGGIRTHTVARFRDAGADVIVPGSAFFGAPDLAAAAARLRLGAE